MSTSTQEAIRELIIRRRGIKAFAVSAALTVAIVGGASPAAAGVTGEHQVAVGEGQSELSQLVRLFQNAQPGGAAQFRLREAIDHIVYV
jgi:hypothetical protein